MYYVLIHRGIIVQLSGFSCQTKVMLQNTVAIHSNIHTTT